ncbi:DUF6165 family protein [Sediminicoccus sp. KRV36]|uniref:DUF6165 family protein n=1 Tax=Sediminicoccus sp. KRV36 TaxID=3133721 RepID=UPI002010B5C9|nr:DUF6165 family protein [Sediminicoccus rosea]UPY36959.1 DUF6165 family protein [Sediminicoccus rosea]
MTGSTSAGEGAADQGLAGQAAEAPGSPGRFEIWAPVSFGELVDKVSILRLKACFIRDAAKQALVATELAMLLELLDAALRHRDGPDIRAGMAALAAVNRQLWEIEDDIRAHDVRQDFGPGFIALARAVYTRNDERAAIKARLNALFGSQVVEVKSYGGAA